jgi:activator of HSP90 ATPase
MVSFNVSHTFSTAAKRLYQALLNSEQHSKMTGGEATYSDIEGEAFTAWDGCISGVNIELNENQRIVQTLRTTEFPEDEGDSKIEITLSEMDGKCEFTLKHTNIPEGQSDYKKGWIEQYFEPMAEYFDSIIRQV